jgi:hypothetical protein
MPGEKIVDERSDQAGEPAGHGVKTHHPKRKGKLREGVGLMKPEVELPR